MVDLSWVPLALAALALVLAAAAAWGGARSKRDQRQHIERLELDVRRLEDMESVRGAVLSQAVRKPADQPARVRAVRLRAEQLAWGATQHADAGVFRVRLSAPLPANASPHRLTEMWQAVEALVELSARVGPRRRGGDGEAVLGERLRIGRASTALAAPLDEPVLVRSARYGSPFTVELVQGVSPEQAALIAMVTYSVQDLIRKGPDSGLIQLLMHLSVLGEWRASVRRGLQERGSSNQDEEPESDENGSAGVDEVPVPSLMYVAPGDAAELAARSGLTQEQVAPIVPLVRDGLEIEVVQVPDVPGDGGEPDEAIGG